MTQAPEQFVVPVPEISWIQGLPEFIALRDVYVAPGTNGFVITCITDSYCMLQVRWERTNPPADPGGQPLTGILTEAGPVIHHEFIAPPGTIPTFGRQQMANEIRYEIMLSPSDTSGRQLRDYVSTFKMRQQPWNFVPVRFYDFGGTPPPPPGGDEGFWNTYDWSQYNPNGQPFSTVPYAYYDITATNGSEVFPAARVFSRYVAPTGQTIGLHLTYPVPDVANAIPTVPDPLQSAMLEISLGGPPPNDILRERWCWPVPQPGELEAVEALIRATANSKIVRIARLINNPGSPRPTYLGPNYWLLPVAADTYLVQPSP